MMEIKKYVKQKINKDLHRHDISDSAWEKSKLHTIVKRAHVEEIQEILDNS